MHDPLIRSFGRRKGRTLGDLQKELLETKLPLYQLNLQELENQSLEQIFSNCPKYVLEIGFGNGGHIYNQALRNPGTGFIGSEPYVNGVTTLLKSIHEGEKLPNLKIHPDDVNQIFPLLKPNTLDMIYILFPDPWPKKRHYKRRIITKEFLGKLHNLLKTSGKLIIATDHQTYAEWIFGVLTNQEFFNFTAKNLESCQSEPENWIKTNYQMKAEAQGLKPYFFLLEANSR